MSFNLKIALIASYEQKELLMSRRKIALSLFFLAIFQIAAMAESNQTCTTQSHNPEGLQFMLSVREHQYIFHEGEMISLETTYSAEKNGKYVLNNRNYDRSGRLDEMEEFCILPNFARDPLFDYFNTDQAFVGGGLYSLENLNQVPRKVQLDLNEWKVLPPGTYKIFVISHRVNKSKTVNLHAPEYSPVLLRSNTIELTVTGTNYSWQQQQLEGAISILDNSTASDKEKMHAARILRFLDTDDAVEELVRRLWNSPEKLEWTYEAGLYATTYRPLAVNEMQMMLANRPGEARHHKRFVETLVNLQMISASQKDFAKSRANKNEWRDDLVKERERKIDLYLTK